MDAFNSLSRDHMGVRQSFKAIGEYPFNSLSRDHFLLRKDDVFHYLTILSTPSLGITEPYSGIFRLSAAFCRGSPFAQMISKTTI
jgi:hypothetical protein